MLQHAALNRALMPSLLQEAAPWQSMAELERAADAALASLREQRRQLAAEDVTARLLVQLDERLRSQEDELLDDPSLPAAERIGIVQALHRMNQRVGAYRRFFNTLKPYVRLIHQREQRPVRILELAAGSGEFTLALATLAREREAPIEITGSDYARAYVDAANAKASERKLDTRFIELNAFDLTALASGSYDLVFIAQSLHHFSPGQLAMMIAQSLRIARHAFVGIDGHRSLRLLGLIPLYGMLMARHRGYLHDSWVSIRKFYSAGELELLGRLAAPAACVNTAYLPPGYSLLTVAH